jgi:hypothetical protein
MARSPVEGITQDRVRGRDDNADLPDMSPDELRGERRRLAARLALTREGSRAGSIVESRIRAVDATLAAKAWYVNVVPR